GTTRSGQSRRPSDRDDGHPSGAIRHCLAVHGATTAARRAAALRCAGGLARHRDEPDRTPAPVSRAPATSCRAASGGPSAERISPTLRGHLRRVVFGGRSRLYTTAVAA